MHYFIQIASTRCTDKFKASILLCETKVVLFYVKLKYEYSITCRRKMYLKNDLYEMRVDDMLG